MDTLNGDVDRSDVLHTCPECGGNFGAVLGALIVVQTCWGCQGAGVLTNDQLNAYLREANRRAREGTS